MPETRTIPVDRLPDDVEHWLIGHTVHEVERQLILHTLEHHHWNRMRAARGLGISIRTMRNKLCRYGKDGRAPINPPNVRTEKDSLVWW